MDILTTNLFRVQGEQSLRIDVKYHTFQSTKDFYTFEELFLIQKNKEIDIQELNDDFFYSEIGNADNNGFVNPTRVNLEDDNFLTASLVKKINDKDIQKPEMFSILIPKVRPNLGKYIFVDNSYENIFFTKAFIPVKPRCRSIVFYYLLKTVLKEHLLSVCRIGKGYPTINEKDLRKIKFPKNIVDRTLRRDDLEKSIYNLHREVKCLERIKRENSIIGIIDNVFSTYFDYDYDKFEFLSSNKVQNIGFNAFANNTDLRFSSKFHREAGKFVYSELEKNSIKIKKVLESLSITGKGISPQNFEEDTDCYYITMADISSWEIDYENLKTVSKEYEDNNSTKKPKGEKVSHSTKVKVGDILMMRSGEGGIGKVALVTEEINAIFSDFLILFRFDKKKYLPQFCYYYMRTKYFQYLVEINKKGLGNNTNIFPNNTNEFPIPNISIDEQKIIVSDIEKKINEQKNIEKEIERLQEQISNIVEESINI